MSNPFDKESLSQREKDILEDGGWQCSFCATVNASYITTCSCSHNRDDSYENLHGRYVPRQDEEWSEAGITVEGPAETIQPPPVSQEIPFQPAASEPALEKIGLEPAVALASVPESSITPDPPKPKPTVSNTDRPLEEYTEYEQGILKDGGWECAFCSRINANYITTCACGHSTDDSYLKRRGRYVDPNGTEQETEEESSSGYQSSESAASPAAARPAEKTGDELIAEIEQELQKNDSPTARLRAIRKFKDLNKKGYMSVEELNRRMDELMGFDEDEESSEHPMEDTTAATAENSTQEEELELL